MIFAPEICAHSWVQLSWLDDSCSVRLFGDGIEVPRVLATNVRTSELERMIQAEIDVGMPPLGSGRDRLDDVAFWNRATNALNQRQVLEPSIDSACSTTPSTRGNDSLDAMNTVRLSIEREPSPPRGSSPSRSDSHDSLDVLETRHSDSPTSNTDGIYSVGYRIAGRFRVQGRLGQGGMGEVYEVFDDETNELRALKTVRGDWLRSEAAQRRFREEATLSQKLRHPGIVATYDIGIDGGTRFFTMELVTGGSLRGRIDSRREKGEPFSLREAVELVEQILDALAYAHARTIHRDIKPENILLTTEGKAKLADFGLATLVDPSKRESMAHRVGTAYYMAPEQFRGEPTIDGRADLYSVGVLLYELLVGRVPQGASEGPCRVRRDCSHALDRVVMRSIAPERDLRFADATQFRKALHLAVYGHARTSPGGAAEEGRTGQRWRTSLGAAIVCLVIALTGFASWRWVTNDLVRHFGFPGAKPKSRPTAQTSQPIAEVSPQDVPASAELKVPSASHAFPPAATSPDRPRENAVVPPPTPRAAPQANSQGAIATARARSRTPSQPPAQGAPASKGGCVEIHDEADRQTAEAEFGSLVALDKDAESSTENKLQAWRRFANRYCKTPHDDYAASRVAFWSRQSDP